MLPTTTDRLARAVHRAATRRTLLGRLAPAGVALLAARGRPVPPVAAKKKGCKFAKTPEDAPTLWTLLKSCTTKKTIDIPNNVTLDGAGFTISAKGKRGAFREGVIQNLGPGVAVRNLTLDGSGVANCPSNKPLHGVFLQDAAATIEDSTFRGLCGWAVEPSSDSPDNIVTIQRCTVDATASLKGGIVNRRGTIADCNVTGGPRGISVSVDDLVGTTVSGNTVTGAKVGIEVSDAKAQVTGNTVVGPGPVDGKTIGIELANALGSVSGNSVRNFFSNTETGYGISVDLGSCSVVLGANTFPDPPGNEEDVFNPCPL